MICERCGKEISANTAICPSCGTVVQPPTTYGQYSSKEYGDDQPIPTYDHGISPQVDFEAPHSAIYSSPPKQDFGYGPSYNARTAYQPGTINVTVVNNFNTSSSKNNSGVLLAEIFLSLFGVYGVGWIIAGETSPATTVGRWATQASPLHTTPAPTRRTRFPARFTTFLTLRAPPLPLRKASLGVTWQRPGDDIFRETLTRPHRKGPVSHARLLVLHLLSAVERQRYHVITAE